MADTKSTVPDVNLLPGEDLEGRPGGIFLKWALSWGKRIVVTTELIVILAFLSRFWLDTEVANNTETIDQKKAIVLSESEFEKKFRALSARMQKSQAIEALPSPLVTYVKALPLIPDTVVVSKLLVDSQSIVLVASADEVSLAKLVGKFRNSPDFSGLAIDQVSRGGNTTAVSFSLRANLISTGSANGNN